MPVTGKELEPKIGIDELAAKEVEGYIERIEKQAETKPPTPTPTPSPTSPADQAALARAASQKALGLAPKMQKQQIVLPLTEEGVREGLHHKIIDGIRWLAEWSVYMIKKYPGRVFYRPKES